MAAIKLELEVTDKGSATVTTAVNRMTGSLNQLNTSARSVGTTFSGPLHLGFSNVLTRLTSMHTIVGTLTGATGFGFLAREVIAAAEGTEQLSDAWDAVKKQLAGYVKENPKTKDALKEIETGVKDWGTALTENKKVVQDWSEFVLSATLTAVSGIGKAFSASVKAMSSLQKAVDYYAKAEVKADPGEFIPGFYEGAIPGEIGAAGSGGNMAYTERELASSMLQGMLSGGRVTYSGAEGSGGSPKAPVTIYNFNQSLGRSDILNILNESARQQFRDSVDTGPPDAEW